MIYIVGIGPGSVQYILPKAIEIISKSQKIIGFSRVVNSLCKIDILKEKEFIVVSKLSEIIEFINKYKNTDIALVASGDPSFYSIANYIKSNCSEAIELIPGISSFQYLSCKLGVLWNNAFIGSLHGRDNEFLEKVLNYNLSFWLTDKKNNPSSLAKILLKNNIQCKLIVGENLSYEDEKITIGIPKDFIEKEFSDLTVVAIDKEIN